MKRYTLIGIFKYNNEEYYDELILRDQVKHNLENIDYITSKLTKQDLINHYNNKYYTFKIIYNYKGERKLDVIYNNKDLKNISESIINRKKNNEKNIKIDRNLPSFDNIINQFFKNIKNTYFTDKDNKYISFAVKQCILEYIDDLREDQAISGKKEDTLEVKNTIIDYISNYKEIRGFIAYLQNQEQFKIKREQHKKNKEMENFKKNNPWYDQCEQWGVDPDEAAFLSKEELKKMNGEDSERHR